MKEIPEEIKFLRLTAEQFNERANEIALKFKKARTLKEESDTRQEMRNFLDINFPYGEKDFYIDSSGDLHIVIKHQLREPKPLGQL